VFYVNHFPVFGFPYGTFTIKRGRKSGLLVPEPGYNSNDGKYINNIAYYQVLGDYADATMTFNYMEKTGWDAILEGRYAQRYRMNGTFTAQLEKRLLNMGQTRYDWLLQASHKQNIGYASTLNASLKFVSSRAIWAGSTDTDERLSESVTSSMRYETPLFSRTLSAAASYTDDLLNDTKKITLPTSATRCPPSPSTSSL
jgi:lipopolysaccharide assembly outer membrane protein LptD (OstA)